MRNIWILTSARSDYGVLRPVMNAVERHPDLHLSVIAGGMQLATSFGSTISEIKQDGFRVKAAIPYILDLDSPEAVATSMGLGVIQYSHLFAEERPDILVVLGDRFDMICCVLAALPFTFPIAHIHGGEVTEGVIDESIRHSVTKMAHLHFASTKAYRDRIVQMGEEPWRVTVSGAPSLDNLNELQLLDKTSLEDLIGISLDEKPLLATLHPVTLETENTINMIEQFFGGLEASGKNVIFTYPNADTSGRLIIEAINQFVKKHSDRARVAKSLGQRGYFALMKLAAAMVGNSSSGIIEAASFKLPVVNIGIRQKGRIHDRNVIDVPEFDKLAILAAIEKAASFEFHESLNTLENPYGDGHASKRIVDILAKINLDKKLIQKSFNDIPGVS